MKSTKLGISVGLIGAIIYFSSAFGGGYLIALLLCGYVLLAEDNAWLRKTSVKAVVLMISFSLLNVILGIIPEMWGIITSLLSIFNKYPSSSFIAGCSSAITGVISLIRSILFIILGLKAFNQGTIRLPIIDAFIDKHMD